MSTLRTRTSLLVLTVLAALLGAQPAGAQTVLLMVTEAANSQPLLPPLAVREGVSASLFDAGCIVLDAPAGGRLPAPAEAARLARSAGAEVALEVSTEYADTSVEANLLRIAARTTYAVIDPATSGVLARGTREATNSGREKDVGRVALGAEIGKDVARVIQDVLDRRARGG